MSSAYGAAAAWRRRWYAQHPARRQRLPRPVVSVGNLRAGGSGKTPIVEHIARLLLAAGEKPAILSRGYGRRVASPGVTVVSDGTHVLADVDAAGDEPLMLARALDGVPVLVCANRYQSGRLAEERFAATVHVLDDGFQYLTLERDVDLLLLGEDDLSERLIPAGRLREPLAAAAAADAILTTGPTSDADRLRKAIGVETIFHVRRSIGTPRLLRTGAPIDQSGRPVFACAAIARPERFFDDLMAAGWRVGGTLAFRDHHWFTDADIVRLARGARDAGAEVVLTTEKDAVRLAGRDLGDLAVASVPLTASLAPAGFGDWLFDRLRAAARRPGPS